jgi:tetratricopeptide (TPR) repeat protein
MKALDWAAAAAALRRGIGRQARPLPLEGQLAQRLLNLGDREEAVAMARRVAERAAPEEASALDRAAQVLEQAELASEALEIYRRILDAGPRHAAAKAAIERLEGR